MVHVPVLLNEVVYFLNLKKGQIVLDATVDGGGHARAIIERIMPGGKLVGIDQDKRLLDELELKIKNYEFRKNIILVRGNFRDLDELFKPLKIKFFDSVLFDLGMSSFQIEKSKSGFTFKKDEPLNMNFKYPLEPGDLTAKEILNNWPENKIYQILKDYGEIRESRRISHTIVQHRQIRLFETTFDLVRLVGQVKFKRSRFHPATKIFQALRVAVNDELAALREGLAASWNFLRKDGRMVVLSFHSLEDRIVKNFFKEKLKEGQGYILIKKPVLPSFEEIKLNPRSRSAKLRVILKK